MMVGIVNIVAFELKIRNVHCAAVEQWKIECGTESESPANFSSATFFALRGLKGICVAFLR